MYTSYTWMASVAPAPVGDMPTSHGVQYTSSEETAGPKRRQLGTVGHTQLSCHAHHKLSLHHWSPIF